MRETAQERFDRWRMKVYFPMANRISTGEMMAIRGCIESCGVIYIATGRRYVDMAWNSARSVRRHNPDLAIHLFSDAPNRPCDLEDSDCPFTSWGEIADPHRRSKVDCISQTPFERTLFLDTDTKVVCNLSDLFGLLDRFDIALAHAMIRNKAIKQEKAKLHTPNSFPQFNSGVILFKSNPKTLAVLEEWRDWFCEAKLRHDQNTLKELLWSSDLRIATLPPEYNIRFIKYVLMWKKLEARPAIYHTAYLKDGPFAYVKKWPKKTKRRIGQLFRDFSASP